MRLVPVLAFVVVAGSPFATAGPATRLPFVSNDYPSALARAKNEKRPLFVESWAPW
jgi:hypothetical protein